MVIVIGWFSSILSAVQLSNVVRGLYYWKDYSYVVQDLSNKYLKLKISSDNEKISNMGGGGALGEEVLN